MSLSDDIRTAKAKLPLPQLLEAMGDGAYTKSNTKSPFRDGDNKGCFGIFKKDDGAYNWKDQVTGEFGDEIDYIAARQNKSKEEATTAYLAMAGIERPEGESKFERAMNGSLPKIASLAFDWIICVEAMAGQVAQVAEWRGYTPEFLEAFRTTGGIGYYENKVAFPVHDEHGKVIGCHYRADSGDWFYTKGCRTSPVVIGSPSKAKEILILESQWDALAIADRLGWHTWPNDDELAIIATRGAGNGKLAGPFIRPDAKIYVATQNDKPDLKSGKIPADEWEKAVFEAAGSCPVHRIAVPKEHKDLNDWTKAGVSGADLWEAMGRASRARKSILSVRTVGEIMGMDFDDSDCYFGDRIIAAGQPVTVLGPGGIGKSRLLMQMALCMITGRDFLDMPTHAIEKKWLIIQTENSNRRLQIDLKNMLIHLRMRPDEADLINQCLFIHTLERDEDVFVDVANPDDFRQLSSLILDFACDFVVFDPLNCFTSGDLNKDQDMKAAVTSLSRLVKTGNPDRVPVVVHHAITGKAGAAKAVGWEKASYGRNSKVLQSWTRAQINIAPQDPDDPTKLVMSCGKNNNGRLFPDMGVLYDPAKGIYFLNPEFDSEAFRQEIGLNRGGPKRIIITPEQVAELFDDSTDRSALTKRIIEQHGCAKSRAYEAIASAEKAKTIVKKVGSKWNAVFEKPNPQGVMI